MAARTCRADRPPACPLSGVDLSGPLDLGFEGCSRVPFIGGQSDQYEDNIMSIIKSNL
jgi:hypothetical protein